MVKCHIFALSHAHSRLYAPTLFLAIIMPFTQDNRQISITTPLGPDVLLFRSMNATERLSDLFEYQVELQSTNKNIPFASIVGKNVTITLKLQDGGERFYNGIVTRFSSYGGFGQFTNYVAIIRPWAWLLTRSTDCCIFQEKTVIEIVTEICEKGVYGGHSRLDKSLLGGGYPTLDYCVQYRESDYNFIHRLLEHAGIYFFFKHEKGMHTMVLVDSSGGHKPYPKYETIKFATDDSRDKYGDERITSWFTTGEIQASGYEMNDFDFETALNCTFGILRVKESIPAAFDQPAYQQYDYPGNYTKADVGQKLAVARMEAIHGQCEQIEAITNARGLTVGCKFSMERHPVDAHNREYLIVAANYRLSSDDYQASGSGDGGKLFEARFEAMGTKYRYRAPTEAAKPMVQGPQTAMVVGKKGEEIWTDKYGRVKVQFHWDRKGKQDEKSSCWVRVAQNWAGRRWGAMMIPRIGMEVVVEFLEGDPDCPLIIGCVYNSDTMPPYDLPANQTRSTIKTNSSKGGSGFNELRFEDKKGAEEIFVQAEKDHNRVVKHNDTLKVGFEYKQPGSQTVEIKHNQGIEVGNNQTVHVIKDMSVTIDGKHAMDIGTTSQVQAKTSIEFKVGGSSILIEPAKITIKSTMVAIEASALGSFKGTPLKLN
jgi:type VI secretion system secreted protein VgrG